MVPDEDEVITSEELHIGKPLPSTTHAKPFARTWLRSLLEQNRNPTTPKCLHDKALVVAPMVDQSDYPFRLLCRKYGANLAFTPMIHSRLFREKPMYQKKFWKFNRRETPLIAQFCGNDPAILVESCRLIHKEVDGIDLNCGCPQGIARRGNYGAYLLEKSHVLLTVVRALRRELDVPISVKVRLLPSGREDSLRLYRALVNAGANMITIHGRDRFQKGPLTGRADWDAIREAALDPDIGGKVPVLANGGIGNLNDVKSCLNHTNADGVMSSEALLEYPATFLETHQRISRTKLAREYLDLARMYPPEQGGQGSGIKCVRVHLHRILHADLQSYPNIRDKVAYAQSTFDLEAALDEIDQIHLDTGHDVQNEEASWYVRHTKIIQTQEGDLVSALEHRMSKDKTITPVNLIEEDGGLCFGDMFGEAW